LRSVLTPAPSAVPLRVIDEIWNEHRQAWYQWRTERITKDAQQLTSSLRKQFSGLPIVLQMLSTRR
jgi:hypothetical protein